jgi:hypothetical protein
MKLIEEKFLRLKIWIIYENDANNNAKLRYYYSLYNIYIYI